MNLWLVLPAIALLAALYVLLPVAIAMSARFRAGSVVPCPASGRNASILVTRAGLAEALGCPSLRGVAMCSEWPARAGCARECLSLVDETPPSVGATA